MKEETAISSYNQILKSSKVLLTTHDRPDGDALSSTCFIADLLEELHIGFKIFCKHLPPSYFSFLPNIEKFSDEKNFDFKDFDLLIALDCGDKKRTNLEEEINRKSDKLKIIEIDHHPKKDDYSNFEIRNSQAASTTEVIYDFCKINNIKINKQRATCILTGLTADTGNFLYPSTNFKNVEIAAEMMRLGARLPKILENTWKNKNLNTMKMWGKAIDNLEINQKYNFAYTILDNHDIIKNNVSEEELEGMSGFLSNLHGVKGLLVLRETEPGKIKGSLRTLKHNIDVSKLARALGGGGHKKASGFRLNGVITKTSKGWKIE